MTLSQLQKKDRRENPRARLQLRLAVIYPQRDGKPAHPVFHGVTHDISMSGLSLLAEENVYREGRLTVLLSLPPVHSWASQRIVSATVEMTYAIRSSKLNAYKIGMTFQEFKDDAKELLQAALSKHRNKDESGDTFDLGIGAQEILSTDSRPQGW